MRLMSPRKNKSSVTPQAPKPPKGGSKGPLKPDDPKTQVGKGGGK